jgi:hypothetical protein
MARKGQPEPPGKPEVTPEVGIDLLRKQIEKAKALLEARPLTSDADGQWQLLTRNYLEKAFGVGSPSVPFRKCLMRSQTVSGFPV